MNGPIPPPVSPADAHDIVARAVDDLRVETGMHVVLIVHNPMGPPGQNTTIGSNLASEDVTRLLRVLTAAREGRYFLAPATKQ
jgi:hypothetical protein